MDLGAAASDAEIKLGADNDSITIGTTANGMTIYGGEGTDSFSIVGAAGATGANTISDTQGASYIFMDGDQTNSSITTGSGADTLDLNNTGNEVITTSNISVGAGNDTLRSSISMVLPSQLATVMTALK